VVVEVNWLERKKRGINIDGLQRLESVVMMRSRNGRKKLQVGCLI